jgi:UDP-N-acetylmuramate: L-alanyl-gamma-D-glutamyl-meso-diaminopimelate ligase
VLEPRSWSLRRNVFQERLAACFEAADEIIVASVFHPDEIPAEQRLDPDRLVRELAARGRPARFLADADAIASHLTQAAKPGDVIAVLSNGGFDGLHDKLLRGLERRAAERGGRG